MLWARNDFEIVISSRLLHELETVLLRRKFRAKLTYEQVLEHVLWLRDGGILADEGDEFPAFTADPDDDHLVALTLFTDADVLVSGDGRLLELEGENMPDIVRPARFLEMLTRGR